MSKAKEWAVNKCPVSEGRNIKGHQVKIRKNTDGNLSLTSAISLHCDQHSQKDDVNMAATLYVILYPGFPQGLSDEPKI